MPKLPAGHPVTPPPRDDITDRIVDAEFDRKLAQEVSAGIVDEADFDAQAEAAQADQFAGKTLDPDSGEVVADAPKVGVKPKPATRAKVGGSLFTKIEDVREYLRILYWGREGSGKTTDALTLANLGKVLVVNAEGGLKKNALRQRGINVDNIYIWPQPGEPVTHAGLDAVFRELKADLSKDPNSWAGAVFDSASDIVQGFTGRVSDDRVSKARLRGAQIDEFDQWATDRGDYGTAGRQFMDLLRKFRDLQLHFVITALERRDVDEDTSKVSYGPSVNPGLQSALLGYVDLVLRTAEPDDTHDYYRALTKAGGRFRTKDRLGVLPKVLVTPTAERVVAYVEGDITEETDPEQKVLVGVEDTKTITKPKPETPAQKRARLAAEKAEAAATPAASADGTS